MAIIMMLPRACTLHGASLTYADSVLSVSRGELPTPYLESVAGNSHPYLLKPPYTTNSTKVIIQSLIM